MKYAIYDRSANSYLTKMVFEGGYSNDTQFTCGLTEYITDAQLLDTKEAANLAVANIENFKFMEKGRFVVHSFDEALADQYLISEAGNPTKVVDNITVDLDGTTNVKYGTMMFHWSTMSLEYAINRLNKLQEAKSPKYSTWCNTFDVYKVITITDERSCNHWQFINVTDKGIVSAKKEANSITKHIEKLDQKNDNLEAKIESIKREARNWKNLYENASDEREELKNAIDIIRSDLLSTTACDDLKDTLNALKSNSGLDRISMNNFLTAKDEIRSIVNKMIRIMESRELNKNDDKPAENVDKYHEAIANDIINICEADDKFDITLKKFAQLYEAVNDPSDNDDTIMYAFKGVLEILSSIEDHVRNIIDDGVYWKNKAKKAEKDKDNQKKLNKANVDTISRLADEKCDMNKEIKELRTMRDCLAEIIHAIRNAICDNNSGAFDCIESRMIHDSDFNSSPFMAGARENIKDICDAGKRNIANYAFKCRELSKSANELSDAADALEEVNDKNEGLTNILKDVTDRIADIMVATRKMDHDEMVSELIGISRKIGFKTRDDGPIFGILVIVNTLIVITKEGTDWKRRAEEAINDYTKCNEALGEWKRKCKAKDCEYEMLANKLEACENILDSTHSLLTKITEERDKALEQKEFYKRHANSLYGMIIPCRCNSKQMLYDVVTGKKIPVDKKKYDDLVECVNNINTTYEILKCADFTMDKPSWFDGIVKLIKNLT